jgi:hypothetical protein
LPCLAAAGLALIMLPPHSVTAMAAEDPSGPAGILSLDMGGSMPGNLEGIGNDVVWRHPLSTKLLPIPRMSVSSIHFTPTRKPKPLPLSLVLHTEEIVPALSLDALTERSAEITTPWGKASVPRTAIRRIERHRGSPAMAFETEWRFWSEPSDSYRWLDSLGDARSMWSVTPEGLIALAPGASAARDLREVPDILTVTFDVTWSGSPVISVLLLPPKDPERPSGLGPAYRLKVALGAAAIMRDEEKLAGGAIPPELLLSSRTRISIMLDRRARRIVMFAGNRRVVSWQERGEWSATGTALGFTAPAANIALSNVHLSAGVPTMVFGDAPRDRTADRLAFLSGAILTGTELVVAAGKAQIKTKVLGLVSFPMTEVACLTTGQPGEEDEAEDEAEDDAGEDVNFAGTAIVLTDGGTLRAEVERLQGGSLLCKHPLLGPLELGLDDVEAILMQPDSDPDALGPPVPHMFGQAEGLPR